MSLKNPKAGAMSVGHYQISSIPWVTSSNLAGAGKPVSRYHLPRLSRFLHFSVVSGDILTTAPPDHQMAIAFTSGALNGTHDRVSQNFYLLNAGQQVTLDVRVDRFFLSSSKGTPRFSCVAGLTMIETDMQPQLTGSLKGVYSGVG